MITIHTYFCPVCGNGYESKGAARQEDAGDQALWCPTCDEKLQISGSALMLAGFLGAVLSGFVLPCHVRSVGMLVFVACSVVGLMRMVKQFSAKRKSRNT